MKNRKSSKMKSKLMYGKKNIMKRIRFSSIGSFTRRFYYIRIIIILFGTRVQTCSPPQTAMPGG